MHLDFLKRIGIVFLACVIFASTASAQNDDEPQYIDIDLGEREAGRFYTQSLGAKNLDCPQPLDFEFSTQAPWLQFPSDSVVRQVSTGQTRKITATLDFSNVAPGQYEAIVEVDCANCGFLIFKNCQIDKQQLRIHVLVVAPAPQGPQGEQGQQGQAGPQGPVLNPLTSPQIDYKDKRIPRRLRNKAKATHKAWALALKKKNNCDKELAILKAANDTAQKKADEAKRIADIADQDLRNANAQNEAAQTELKNATIAESKAQDAIKAAKADLNQANRNGTSAERAEAKAALAAAKAAKKSAEQRRRDAGQSTNLHSSQDIRAMKRDAKNKRKLAGNAAKKAAAANKALKEKQAECLKLQQDTATAQAANEKAEKDAKDAIPPPPQVVRPTPEQIEAQRLKLQNCSDRLGELLEAQRLALEAMAKLGMLKGKTESDFTSWANGVDKANDLFNKVPPGIPVVSGMIGTVTEALTFVRVVIGVASAVTTTGNLNYRPVAGEFKDVDKAESWLQEEGFASSDAEAKRIADQMKLYSLTNSTAGMEQAIEQARAKCDAHVKKFEDMENAAKGG